MCTRYSFEGVLRIVMGDFQGKEQNTPMQQARQQL